MADPDFGFVLVSGAEMLANLKPKPHRNSGKIETDQTPVPCRGEPLAEIWWRGKQWAVTADGIECLDGCYCIDKNRLLQDLPAYSWPEHMATKGWVDTDEFATAWLVALALHTRRDASTIRNRLAMLPPPRPRIFPRFLGEQ